MIYFADISKLNTDDPVWSPYISSARRQKLNACRLPEQIRQCLGAELLLQYAVLNENQRETLPLEYQYDGKGKPVADQTLFISFSHSGNYAACAVSDQPIGIDIQRQTKDAKNLEKMFTKNQLDMIKTMTPQKQKTALFDFWTLKESVFKATGHGSIRQPVDFRFHNENGRLAMTYEDYNLQYYNIIPGYSLGVCSAAPLSPFLFNLSLDKIRAQLTQGKAGM